MKSMYAANIYLMNNRALAGRRAVSYVEFGDKEITKTPELMNYLGLWKGKY